MRWRPSRLPRTSFATDIARLLQPAVERRLYSSQVTAAATPNIAAILATRPKGDDEVITAVGSVRTIRNQKQRSFVEIGDGSTIHPLQALLQPAQAQGLGTGTSVAVRGRWRAAPKGKEQAYELEAENVEIVGATDPEASPATTAATSKYPIQKKYHSAEYLRTIPHLRLRTPLNALLARLKSECDFHITDYFRTHGFVRVQPPIITSSDCEGAGEVFRVSSRVPANDAPAKTHGREVHEEFFRESKFLTVSSQLHLEAFVHEHPKVWTMSPTFRAEKSDTPRHVSEFWMLEAELRTDSMNAVMDVVGKMLSHLVNRLKNSSLQQELTAVAPKADVYDLDQKQRTERLQERWDGIARVPYPRITYSDAIDLLQKAAASQETLFQNKPHWNKGLQLEHERYIAAYVGQGSPVFVTDYPAEIKPFYMLPSTIARDTDHHHHPHQPTAACFDLLFPDGTEVVGGSMREHRLDNLTQAMRAHGLMAPGPSSSSPHPNPGTSTAEEEDDPFPPQNVSSAVAINDDSGSGGDLNWYLDLRRYGSVPHGGFGLGFDRLVGYLAGVGSVRDVVAWPRYYGRCDG